MFLFGNRVPTEIVNDYKDTYPPLIAKSMVSLICLYYYLYYVLYYLGKQVNSFAHIIMC